LLAAAAEYSMRVKRGLAAVDAWQNETGVVVSTDDITEVDSLLDTARVGHVTVTPSLDARSSTLE
jgi:hypothetical protein